MITLNNNWYFTPLWEDDLLEKCAGEPVRIPHNVRDVPLHYVDPASYQTVCGYTRYVHVEEEWKGKHLILRFEGAAHIAEVYVNGVKAAEHRCGYTAFSAEITDMVVYGEDNLISVKLDTTENGSVPPFGFAIDYLTFGGIYRDVRLDIRGDVYLDDVYFACTGNDSVNVHVSLNRKTEDEKLRISFLDAEGECVFTRDHPAADGVYTCRLRQPKLWSPDQPYLYTAKAELVRDGEVTDTFSCPFGFRTVSLTKNDILINGKPVFLRGLNRHQCIPYRGYALTESLQREDARILDEELGVNAVRTSHYPQSHYFIDECDRRGILVFTEIPGWQHIGDEAWKQQAVVNTEEMVREYRNHPSIILWGVRINESQDDDAFYEKTNAAAHRLDPYRPTSGVRYLEKSSLLEAVYSYNDFSHNGTNSGARKKKEVTPDPSRPLLITESNGHMFPTKSFDTHERRQEQALRHARVMAAAYGDGEHAGVFQWCMFDYPTHQDFGSGDRICYHGVMDSFRNPKTAAAVYASQSDRGSVLEVGSPMDIGDYPAGNIPSVWAFTNADSIRLYKNDDFVKEFFPDPENKMPHPPVLIDDTIGSLLEEKEGFDKKKAGLIRECLLAAGKYGLTNLPARYKAELAWCMVHYGMKFSDGYDLYGKYVGNWGGKAVSWRFDAVKDGKVTASVTKQPDTDLHIETKVSSSVLHEGDTYDMCAVRIRILDSFGNTASYAQLPLKLTCEGVLRIVGPDVITAEGGMSGTYLETTGEKGKAVLTVTAEGLKPAVIELEVR